MKFFALFTGVFRYDWKYGIPYSSEIILRGVAFCFAIAFASFWWQSPGLYGSAPSSFSSTNHTNSVYVSKGDPVGLAPLYPFMKKVLKYVTTPPSSSKEKDQQTFILDPIILSFWNMENSQRASTLLLLLVTLWKAMKSWPTLLWFAPSFNLLFEELLDVLSVIGFFSSLFLVVLPFSSSSSLSRRRSTPLTLTIIGGIRVLLFVLIWICYLSLFKVGQVFLSFQWDILLLESGFLCILLSVSLHSPRLTKLSLWMFRWLLFRLMFASGVVKLTSNCPTWWGLTALTFHYETQCIPTSLAWFPHQLPLFFQKLSVALTLVLEILGPFLFLFPNLEHFSSSSSSSSPSSTPSTLSPLLRPRNFSALLQIVLQILIALTGNYAWFNLLTAILAFSLLDDDSISFFVRKYRRRTRTFSSPSHSSFYSNYTSSASATTLSSSSSSSSFSSSSSSSFMFNFLVFLFYVLILKGITLFFFPMTFSSSPSSSFVNRLDMATGFNRAQLDHFLTFAVPLSCLLFGIAILGRALAALLEPFYKIRSSWNDPQSRRSSAFIALLVDFSFVIVLISIIYVMFVASTVTLAETSSSPLYRPPTLTHPQLVEAYSSLATNLFSSTVPWNLISSYGLFRSMTTTRPEVILEGYDGKEWIPYEFKYKVGNVSRPPPTWVAPHQPRLDWQMWFAALQPYEYNTWLIHLMYKLLENSPSTLALLDSNPFPVSPPTFVRARLFDYQFTLVNSSFSFPPQVWWVRKFVKDYIPRPLSAKDLADYLKSQEWDRESFDSYSRVILERRRKSMKSSFFSLVGHKLVEFLTLDLRNLRQDLVFYFILFSLSLALLSSYL